MRIGRLLRISAVLAAILLLSGCLSHFGIIPPPVMHDGEKPPLALLFDMGSGNLASGYTRVTCNAVYSAATGWGFASAVDSRDRGGDDPLRGDFCVHGSEIDFRVDVPNGWYSVKVISGDRISSQASQTWDIEGEQFSTSSVGANSYIEETRTVQVTDGQINIRVTGDNTVRLNGVEIVELPGGPAA